MRRPSLSPDSCVIAVISYRRPQLCPAESRPLKAGAAMYDRDQRAPPSVRTRRGGFMKILMRSAIAFCVLASAGVAIATAARAQSAPKLFFEGDMVRSAQQGAPGP